MTDEAFIYRNDVNERANIARLSKSRVSKSGCRLPSDNMSHWAKKRQNGALITVYPDRPILYDDFKELGEDSQREYLQGLIDNHGGTTERIAKMWGVSEAKVKNHRQLLGIKSYISYSANGLDMQDAMKWTEFLCAGDFLKEPMSYADFKKLSKNEKKAYLNYLNIELDGSPDEIAYMFGINHTNVREWLKKCEVAVHTKAYRYGHTKWNDWLKKYDANCGVHQIDEQTYESNCIEPNIPVPEDAPSTTESTEPGSTEQTTVEIRESDIPYLNLIMTVKDYEQIFDILKTLPRAKAGTITFTFGEEDDKVET